VIKEVEEAVEAVEIEVEALEEQKEEATKLPRHLPLIVAVSLEAEADIAVQVTLMF
jgi:hypothetical protein